MNISFQIDESQDTEEQGISAKLNAISRGTNAKVRVKDNLMSKNVFSPVSSRDINASPDLILVNPQSTKFLQGSPVTTPTALRKPFNQNLQSKIRDILDTNERRASEASTIYGLKYKKRIIEQSPALNDSSEVPNSSPKTLKFKASLLEDMKKRRLTFEDSKFLSENKDLYGMQAIEALSQELDEANAEGAQLTLQQELLRSAIKDSSNGPKYLSSIPAARDALLKRKEELSAKIEETEDKSNHLIENIAYLLTLNQSFQSKREKLREKLVLKRQLEETFNCENIGEKLRETKMRHQENPKDRLKAEMIDQTLMKMAKYCLPSDDDAMAKVFFLENLLD